MTTVTPTAVRWRIVARLTGLPQLGSNWLAALGWLTVCGIFGIISSVSFHPDSHGTLPFISAEFLALMTYLIYMLTGPINAVWQTLPVSPQERKAAVWIYVSVLPLLVAFTATIFTVAAGKYLFQDDLLALMPAIFGVQGMLIESFALVIILLANWPGALAWFWTVSNRQIRDWVVALVFICIMFGGMFYGATLVKIRGVGWPSSVLAVGMCAALLPVTQRFARIDVDLSPSSDGFAMPSFGLRLGGWTGHLIKQGIFSLLIVTVLSAGLGIGLTLAPRLLEPKHDARSLATLFHSGFAVALTPVMMGVFIASISLQYLMRQRRQLLSLPRGGTLLMITPAYNALISMLIIALVISPFVPSGTDWIHYAIPCLAGGVAMIYLLLALNLRATSYSDLMLAGGAIGLPAGLIGFLFGVSDGKSEDIVALIEPHLTAATIVAVAVALLSIILCQRLIRHSRKPYRPWPLMQSRWRAA